MSNRIGEQCWYKVWNKETKSLDKRLGFLRMWGTDYEEGVDEVMHFPVAVVEDQETLQVVVVRADWVTFC